MKTEQMMLRAEMCNGKAISRNLNLKSNEIVNLVFISFLVFCLKMQTLIAIYIFVFMWHRKT